MNILKDFLIGVLVFILMCVAGYFLFKFWYVPMGVLIVFGLYMAGKSFRENGYKL